MSSPPALRLAPVYLHIYDIFWTNRFLSRIGCGCYHSGIEIYGSEYGFAGHPFSFSGLLEKVPKDAEELGEQFHYRLSVLLGHTSLTQSEVQDLLCILAHDWHGDKYSLILRNCNHFSDCFSRLLCGRQVLPAWVNRMANGISHIPWLDHIVPKDWMKPGVDEITVEDILGNGVDKTRLWEITFFNKVPIRIYTRRHRRRTSRRSSSKRESGSRKRSESSKATESRKESAPRHESQRRSKDSRKSTHLEDPENDC